MRQRTLLVIALGLLLVSGIAGLAGMAASPEWSGFFTGHPIAMDRAQKSVQSFVDRTGQKDLVVDELMEFDQNFYALVKEKDTGIGACELLVNKRTGAVSFEPGPARMWNTRYGMMGGAGRTGFGVSTGVMSASPERAAGIAQGWLDQRGPGYRAGNPDAFYGYYTFHFLQDGRTSGMLSVNGTSGQVWFHSWHGNFIQSKERAG